MFAIDIRKLVRFRRTDVTFSSVGKNTCLPLYDGGTRGNGNTYLAIHTVKGWQQHATNRRGIEPLSSSSSSSNEQQHLLTLEAMKCDAKATHRSPAVATAHL
jgi:hypothetical protein